VEAIGEDAPEDLRDRALLSLHVSGAFRLVELARLSFAQVRFDRSSAQIHLGRFRSHTARGSSAITIMDDQLLNPVSHLRRWMEACPEQTGSLFRHAGQGRITDQALTESEIAAIIGRRANTCGYDAKAPDGGGLFQIKTGQPAVVDR
jgi:site-specific recombinase XerC